MFMPVGKLNIILCGVYIIHALGVHREANLMKATQKN